MDRKALVPAQPPDSGVRTKPHLSRRTAGLLVIVAGLLVVYHYAHNGGLGPQGIPVIAPALHVTLRGEVVQMAQGHLVVRVEDTKGGLTHLHRVIALSPETQYQSPGVPVTQGPQGVDYIKPGYRVVVRGLAASDGQTVNAAQVSVSFPPVNGTIRSLIGSNLVVSVPGQDHTMTITANSHTDFYVPDGRWSNLTPGAAVRVWISPRTKDPGQFTAVTVMVRTPPS